MLKNSTGITIYKNHPTLEGLVQAAFTYIDGPRDQVSFDLQGSWFSALPVAPEPMLAPDGKELSRPEHISIDVLANGTMSVAIATKRLMITSIVRLDAPAYSEQLLGNPDVMKTFGDGTTRSPEAVLSRVQEWVDRWESGNPFSALTIRTKAGEFVGHLIAGYGSAAGRSEVAYLISSNAWNQGFATEAATAVVKFLTPLLTAYGYKTGGEPIQVIEGTARIDNKGSLIILERMGLHTVRTEEKHGALRHLMEGALDRPAFALSSEIISCQYGTFFREHY